jgi:hypothetical protein
MLSLLRAWSVLSISGSGWTNWKCPADLVMQQVTNNDYGNSHNVPTKKIGVENGKQIKLNIIKSKNTTKNLIKSNTDHTNFFGFF